MSPFNILRCAHAELVVTDLKRARDLYVEALGFIEVETTRDAIYLGGLEERDKYSLILRQGKTAGTTHIAFRVASPEDLEKIAKLHETSGRPYRWVESNSVELGQGKALRVQDPHGLAIEFFHEMEQRERLLQKFELYRGANIMRIDHFNCQVPNVQKAFDWWTKTMGFAFSEGFFTDDQPPQLAAAWLHRKQNVHDLALMQGIGPRLHHIGFWVQDTASVLKACDILASLGMVAHLERGPGRHGLSNAFFLYLRDFDLHRIELYTSDYMIADPDFAPIHWRLSDPRGRTFWGHQAPKSWLEESSLFANIETGEWMPLHHPQQTTPHSDLVT